MISTDKQDVYNNYDSVYHWFETQIILDKAYDGNDVKVAQVTNIFQYIDSEHNPKVVIINHLNDCTVVKDVKDGFYLECCDMNLDTIKTSFTDMLEKVAESNCVKPKTKYITLRNPLGPVRTDAFWIWGTGDLWINAKTGEISMFKALK